ncbi:unnamed protein product [Ilex paraguariensis]|uniref:Uncharacterized protein n=1 Tax=Ilex paraguariensis TaxID=185542 RepID=A0ABC8S229_9AQUA
MASISRPTRTTVARSGGKIVRRRRTAAAKTPYDRAPPPPPPKGPNWLTGLVLPATKMIASGAGRLLSSVFTADTSSSSSSSSEDDSASDDSVDGGNDYDIPSQRIEILNKVHDSVDGGNDYDIPSQRIEILNKHHLSICKQWHLRDLHLHITPHSSIVESHIGVVDKESPTQIWPYYFDGRDKSLAVPAANRGSAMVN